MNERVARPSLSTVDSMGWAALFSGPLAWTSTVAPLSVSDADASTVTDTPLSVIVLPASIS